MQGIDWKRVLPAIASVQTVAVPEGWRDKSATVPINLQI
jgi:hypothetical protein